MFPSIRGSRARQLSGSSYQWGRRRPAPSPPPSPSGSFYPRRRRPTPSPSPPTPRPRPPPHHGPSPTPLPSDTIRRRRPLHTPSPSSPTDLSAPSLDARRRRPSNPDAGSGRAREKGPELSCSRDVLVTLWLSRRRPKRSKRRRHKGGSARPVSARGCRRASGTSSFQVAQVARLLQRRLP